jgi:chromosome segregation ATPase
MDAMHELNYFTALPAVPGLAKPAQVLQQRQRQRRQQSSPGGTSAPSPQFRSSSMQSVRRRKMVDYERPHTRSELAEIDTSLAALTDALGAFQLSSEDDWAQHLAKLAEFSSRCDDMSTHVCDIMSVVSTEAGRCAYKLRHAYQACFQHFQDATNELVGQLQDCQQQLEHTTSEKEALVGQLSEQEQALRAEADARVAQVLAEADKERKLLAEEHGNVREYVDEVNGTLKSLNVIFKTMQV